MQTEIDRIKKQLQLQEESLSQTIKKFEEIKEALEHGRNNWKEQQLLFDTQKSQLIALQEKAPFRSEEELVAPKEEISQKLQQLKEEFARAEKELLEIKEITQSLEKKILYLNEEKGLYDEALNKNQEDFEEQKISLLKELEIAQKERENIENKQRETISILQEKIAFIFEEKERNENALIEEKKQNEWNIAILIQNVEEARKVFSELQTEHLEKMNALQKETILLNRQRDELHQQLLKREQENASVIKDLEEEKKRFASIGTTKDAEISQVSAEIEALNQDRIKAEVAFSQETQEFTALAATFEGTTKLLAEQESAKEGLSEKLAQIEKQLADAEKEKENLHVQMEELISSNNLYLLALDQEKEPNKEQIIALKQELSDAAAYAKTLQVQIRDLEGEIEEYTCEIAKTEEELFHAKKEADELITKLDAAEQELMITKNEYKKTIDVLTESKNKEWFFFQDKEETQAIIHSLHQDIEEKNHILEIQQQDREEIEKRIAQFREQIAKSDQEREELAKLKEEKIDRLNATVEGLSKQRKNLLAEKRDAQAQIYELSSYLEEKSKDLAQLQKESQGLHHVLEETQKQLDAQTHLLNKSQEQLESEVQEKQLQINRLKKAEAKIQQLTEQLSKSEEEKTQVQKDCENQLETIRRIFDDAAKKARETKEEAAEKDALEGNHELPQKVEVLETASEVNEIAANGFEHAS